MFPGKCSVRWSHAHNKQERGSVPFLVECASFYQPGRGGEEPRGWPTVTYTACHVCVVTFSTNRQDNVCSHEPKEEIKHALTYCLRWVHLQPDGCPVLTVSRWLRWLSVCLPGPSTHSLPSTLWFSSPAQTTQYTKSTTQMLTQRETWAEEQGAEVSMLMTRSCCQSCSIKPTHPSSSHATAKQRQILDNTHYVTRAQ